MKSAGSVFSRLAWVLATAIRLSAAPPQAPADLKFNLASIKPNPNPAGPRLQNLPGGVFRATCTLETLVILAFGVEPLQVSGARGWIGSDRFDVDAKAEGAPQKLPEEQFHRMLQALLAERFGLKTHKESKEMSFYALTVGPKGTKLTPRTPDSHPSIPPMPPGKSRFMAVNLKGLCRALSSVTGRLVMDETNLTGDYDIVLDYPVESGSSPSQDAMATAMMDAVQEELGLKLVSRKAAVNIIVIDHAERPIAN
jgi:uncharacterized protein (TIGR03435 family)